MQRIRTSNLVPIAQLNCHILHESGELLLSSGSSLTESHKCLLQQVGIERVYLLDRFDNVVAFPISQKNKYILVDELAESHQIAAPICADDGSIILGSRTAIDSLLREYLKSLGYYTVCVRKRRDELCLHQVRSFLKQKEADFLPVPSLMRVMSA